MGIFLNFVINPFRISPTEWEKTYESALQIADKCSLLDPVLSERNGVKYAFARKSAEREIPYPIFKSNVGIYVRGTMYSGDNMEDFFLLRNLNYYRDETDKGGKEEDNGADILFSEWYIGDSNDEEIPHPNLVDRLWGGKTQGRPGHMALLAIACLFADRFPEAVTVSGDITAGQCNAAVRLVRECLGIDILPPVICRPDALAKRIYVADMPEHLKLMGFFQLYLGSLTEKVGKILQEVFGNDALYRYFRDEIAKNHKKNYGISSEIRNYLLLRLDFAGLLRLMVSDEQGCQMSLETALSKLFSYNIHIPFEEKNCDTPLPSTAEDGDNETPRSIEGLLGSMFFIMAAGRNRNLPVYIPLEEIRTVCRSFVPDSDTIIDRLLQEQQPDEHQELAYADCSHDLRRGVLLY